MKAILNGKFTLTEDLFVKNYPRSREFINETYEIELPRFGVLNMCILFDGEKKRHIFGNRASSSITIVGSKNITENEE